MKMPPLRLSHGLLFIAVALLFFAWGAWLSRQMQPAAPLAELTAWQEQILAPLAEDRLSLAGLQAVVDGELWLQPRPDAARLLYRGSWPVEGETWSLEAELALSSAERDSLMAAAGLERGDAEQPLGAPLLTALGSHAIAALLIQPAPQVLAERLTASLGQPRLRLELEKGQAWVYPALGLTAHTQDDELRLLHAVPRRLLQTP